MTKDKALKMAIEALDTLMMEKGSIYQQALQACKDALEQPTADKPPSREWVGLSDAEIEEAVNYLNVKIDYPIMFARLIEMHLKEKNNA